MKLKKVKIGTKNSIPGNDVPVFTGKYTILSYIVLLVSGFLLYLPTLFYGFTYLDDNVLILDNFYFLSNLSNFWQTFKQQVFHIFSCDAFYYRPLLTISFMFDAQVGGNKPFIYHLTNVIVHLLASFLVCITLLKLKYRRGLAYFFAGWFMVHPILTQAIAWIPGRNDSLLTLFVLSSFIFYLKYVNFAQKRYLFLHWLFLTTALFTKESGGLIVLMCLYYYRYLRLPYDDKCKTEIKLPFWLLVGGWMVIFSIWFYMRRLALGQTFQMKWEDMVGAVWYNSPAIFLFIGKIFVPLNLSVLPILKDSNFIYGIVTFIFLILSIYFTKPKRYPYLIFGGLWFLGLLLPSFIRPNPEIYADFIEHRIYLPMFGIIIVLLETGWVNGLSVNKKINLILAGLIILVYSIVTFSHSKNFATRLNFWLNAAQNSPHSPLAHRNLGAMYYLDGRLAEAEIEFKKSLSLNPNEPMAHNNIGLIYMNKGLYTQAEVEYKTEIAINPNYDTVHANYALLCYRTGRIPEAEQLWLKTISLNPEYVSVYNSLTVLYFLKKDYIRAKYYATELQKRGGKLHPELTKVLFK